MDDAARKRKMRSVWNEVAHLEVADRPWSWYWFGKRMYSAGGFTGNVDRVGGAGSATRNKELLLSDEVTAGGVGLYNISWCDIGAPDDSGVGTVFSTAFD